MGRGRASLILDVGFRWRWVIKSPPHHFIRGKGPHYGWNRRLDGSQSHLEVLRKKCLVATRIGTTDRPDRSRVVIMSCCGSQNSRQRNTWLLCQLLPPAAALCLVAMSNAIFFLWRLLRKNSACRRFTSRSTFFVEVDGNRNLKKVV
jgi:hypothetical protein